MKNQLFNIVLLLLVITSSGCSKSALSDVELYDPSLIKVSVRIAQDADNWKEVQVFIRDKNGRPVHLENGWVEINGLEANWGRAQIHSLSERGYIYQPEAFEHEFRVVINLNPEDAYWFDLNPETGFPGFIHNYPLMAQETYEGHDPYIYDSFSFLNMPFYHGKVKVSYQILGR